MVSANGEFMIERIAENSLTQNENVASDAEHTRLLSLFHPDPERAQREYQTLHSRLMKMCEYRGFVRANELVNKTFRIVSKELVNEEVSVFAVRVAQKLLNELSQEDLDRLLTKLDPNPMEAGRKYEAIRKSLIKFFGSRNCRDPEQLADKSMDRLARRLATEDIQNLGSYARQIAKFVVLEFWRAPEEISLESEQNGDNLLPTPDRVNEFIAAPDEDEEMMDALEECLGHLDQADRDTILAFHDTIPKTKKYLRELLADQMGITRNLLGVKTCRIRKRLETCVNQRIAHH